MISSKGQLRQWQMSMCAMMVAVDVTVLVECLLFDLMSSRVGSFIDEYGSASAQLF